MSKIVGSTNLSKCPGVLSPHEEQLAGHGEQEGGQVCHGQVEQVDVGGGPHVLILQDHQAGGYVTKDPQQEKHPIEYILILT